MILVLGTDDALLEGLAQALVGCGQPVSVVKTVDDAEELARRGAPLLLVAERAMLARPEGQRVAHMAVSGGSALVAYRGYDQSTTTAKLPSELARITLADLELPLERNRLVALALHLAARAREVGRLQPDTPPSPPSG